MTRPTTATATVAPLRTPTTDYGTGFLPVLFRSLLHPLVVHHAIASEWPITNGAAASSLQLALESLTGLGLTVNILGEDAKTALTTWTTQLTAVQGIVQALPAQDDADTTTRDQIRNIYGHALVLLGILDEDLLGINSDGGRIP
jgi:hypothetical protein